MKKKRAKKKSKHYIDNKEFSAAMAEYTEGVKEDQAAGKEPRQITNYIAESFMKIAEGLSHSPNFINYTYREDMVMDAVENCVRAASKFDATKPTRTGKPNPFSYFTQISYFAFLRRIAKEKKQSDIKQSIIDKNDVGSFATFDGDADNIGSTMIESMRYINEEFYDESLSTEASPNVEIIEDNEPAKKSAKKKIEVGPLSDFLA